MLHQITWQAYLLTVLSSVLVYYSIICIGYYRSAFLGLRNRFTGKQVNFHTGSGGIFPASTYSIMGTAAEENAADDIDQIQFAPSENPDETENIPTDPSGAKSSRQIGAFSEMIAEVRTLVRVISESGETKENFAMLFKLVIQKYNTLSGTDYQRQVNEFLLNESKAIFPFEMAAEELNTYWENY